MARNLAAFFGGLIIAAMMFGYAARSSTHEFDAASCVGGPFHTVESRNKALASGFAINKRYNCIDREAYRQANERKLAWPKTAQVDERSSATNNTAQNLSDARHGFVTKISVAANEYQPLPTPPEKLFVRSDYKSSGRTLGAFVTPNPNDAQKHPAIIWLTGGDTNSLKNFWTHGPESNDQSAGAFREAGVITMFPVLRGGNDDRAGKEYFLGEVDDVIAAAEHLAHLPYVDANRIYIGGHSTGGTLALLAAESGAHVAGVFAFGPVAAVDHYSSTVVPVDFGAHDASESKLRSPIYWLSGIAAPTYLIEGKDMPGNRREVESLCAMSHNPQLRCVLVNGADHFSVLAKVSTVIAARLMISDSREFSLRAEEFANDALTLAAL